MMKPNKGFSLVEGIIIIVVVVVIGALGWVFYTNYMATSDDAVSSSTAAESNADVAAVDESMPEVATTDDLQKAEAAVNEIDIDSSVDTSSIDAVLE